MRWNNGCLHKDDFNNLAWSMKVIGNMMMVPHMSGFTDDDGEDYYAVDMLMDYEDIKNAVKILNEFLSITDRG